MVTTTKSRFCTLPSELVTAMPDGIADGISLATKSGGAATGKLFLQTETITTLLPHSLANGKADNQIIAVVMHLRHAHPKRNVILVSKDINMRIKARALGIPAEDYFNDKVLQDTELLYSGMRELPADFWDRHGKGMESWRFLGPMPLWARLACFTGGLNLVYPSVPTDILGLVLIGIPAAIQVMRARRKAG